MPLYEYKCYRCGNRFISLVLPSQKGRPKCPRCGSEEVKRLFSSFASSTASKTSRECFPTG